ncbi:MAG: SurA N-terminal domain-containing protein [Bacteroidaceae bacterium]|nr:SurA N-terminal domain-containing protein [Bacteroidaceae bacterium]
MATLQKIRSKGPLLLIVIGLAMLAFILGDAWKIFRPTQGVQYVGSIAGEKISAQDFQSQLEDYTEIIKFGMGVSDISEELNNQLKDEVWKTMVRDKILKEETEAIGLTVTDAEVREVIEKGTHPTLAETPFRDQNGNFDADMLKNFLSVYENLDRSAIDAQTMESYDGMYKFWLFIEKEIRNDLLGAKYVALVESSIKANSVYEQNSYENRIKRYDLLVASLPYALVSDEEANITASDIKDAYSMNKERLYNSMESRNIYYIDYEILPSQADRDALAAEMEELTAQLSEQTEDFAAFLRRNQSKQTYSEVPRSAEYLPSEVASRLDSVKLNEVCGPIYNADEDSYTSFKLIGKANGYDSIQYCIMSIQAESDEETARLSDSICQAVRSGADFDELASRYGQSGAAQWITSQEYEGASINGDNAKFLNTLNGMKKGQVESIPVSGGNLIVKVTDVRNTVAKYIVATIKRPVEFSEQTSNEAYTKLNLFVARNNSIDSLKANAEQSGFNLLYSRRFTNQQYYIGGVLKSHEALRWAFEANKGEVSRVFEAGSANDHLMVVAVEDIFEKGYTTIKQAGQTLSMEAVRNAKYGLLSSRFDGIKSFEDAASVEGAVVDTIRFCNFTNSIYVPSVMANEPLVGPSANKLANGAYTTPIKGQNCVFVAQKISDDELSVEFDAASEDYRLVTLDKNRINSQTMMNELVNLADIEDFRYKIF